MSQPEKPKKRLSSYNIQIIIGVLTLFFTLMDHIHGYHAYLIRLNTEKTLLPEAEITVEGKALAPISKRLIVLFLDGLGFDQIQDRAILSQGVYRELSIEFPSFTYPAVVVFATGIPPLYSGMRLNQDGDLQNITSHERLPSLLGNYPSLPIYIDFQDWSTFHLLLEPQKTIPNKSYQKALQEIETGLIWVYLQNIDKAGHRYGADSPEYQEAIDTEFQRLESILDSVDLSQDTVMVVSDHGHLPEGSHGGHEAEVRKGAMLLFGAGVQKVEGNAPLAARSYVDVAPTIAAFLGQLPPAKSFGRPMLDVLAIEESDKAKILSLSFSARLALARLLLPDKMIEDSQNVLPRLVQGETTAILPAQIFLDTLTLLQKDSYQKERNKKAVFRLIFVLPIALLLLGFSVWLHLRSPFSFRWSDSFSFLIYSIIFLVLYYSAGYSTSFSLPRGQIGFLLETLLYGALGALVSLFFSYRRHRFQRLVQETWIFCVAFGVPTLLLAAWIGLDTAYLASPELVFLVLFLETIAFYAQGPFGIAVLVRCFYQRRKNSSLENKLPEYA